MKGLKKSILEINIETVISAAVIINVTNSDFFNFSEVNKNESEKHPAYAIYVIYPSILYSVPKNAKYLFSERHEESRVHTIYINNNKIGKISLMYFFLSWLFS